eukprot:TRINITY_DN10272_c0_g1_i2.p1 TRINITY_DN10272_c0_g1~~TRINITY_DN10272_c0_g1_i2.p1  ORF type:complete len:227 (+),score=11.25 TRINITY_DN10272_c0_g1_i2:94-774(+)
MVQLRNGFALACSCICSNVCAYDPTLAFKLAYFEKAVYCGNTSFAKWDVGGASYHGPIVDTSKVYFAHSDSTNAAAGVERWLEPPDCGVALRGTLGTMSVVMDVDFHQVAFERDSCAGCYVDQGFKWNYESIKQEIFDSLDKFGCKNEPLYLTGHSLSAASLHYLFYDAMEAGYNVTTVYAMESPRPGNDTFATAVQQIAQSVDAWRITQYKDCPPTPSTWVPMET